MITGHNIAMSLRAAYWTMHRQADACMSACGVTASQFVLLSLLAESDGITQQELVRRASSDANTVRAMLLLLERQNLVSRISHPRDGRARSVALTPRGRRTYRQMRDESEPFRTSLQENFTPQEAILLCSLLDRIAGWQAPAPGRSTMKPRASRSPRNSAPARNA